jgi:hypothetical protein
MGEDMRNENVTPTGKPGAGEAYEKGNGGAGAEGRHRAQKGGYGVSSQPAEAAQNFFAALGRKEALNVADDKYQQAQQKGYLKHVVQEKLYAAAQAGGNVQPHGRKQRADKAVQPFEPKYLILNEIPDGHGSSSKNNVKSIKLDALPEKDCTAALSRRPYPQQSGSSSVLGVVSRSSSSEAWRRPSSDSL